MLVAAMRIAILEDPSALTTLGRQPEIFQNASKRHWAGEGECRNTKSECTSLSALMTIYYTQASNETLGLPLRDDWSKIPQKTSAQGVRLVAGAQAK